MKNPEQVRPAWMIGSAECDWLEDASYETRSHHCKCVCCYCDFISHPQRYICKRCHAAGEAYTANMTPEERADWEAKAEAAVAAYLQEHRWPPD